jgi:hypothetical protein
MSDSVSAIGGGIDLAKTLDVLPSQESIMNTFGGALSLVRGLVGASGVESAAIPTELLSLIELQRQMQIEMQSISLISNIEKSRHESKMSAIRNVRAN